MKKFVTGKTYQTRSACDHNCVISVEIVSRTEKTVTVKLDGELKTFRVKPLYDGRAEMFLPWGRGSMMPILDATDEVA